MRTAIIALSLLLGGNLHAAEDLSVDEVIAKNIEARGGYEAWTSVDSAKMTGTMTMGTVEAPFRIMYKRPEMIRIEFDVQGLTGVQAYDGETGWYVMPFTGKTEPEKMAEDQIKDMQESADFEGSLVDYEEKGHSVELLGIEEIEGTEAYKVKLTKANGDERIIYIDSEYFLEIKQTSKSQRQGQEVVAHTTLGDYKEVDGLIMPHSVEVQVEGMPGSRTLTMNEIALGVPVETAQFQIPEAQPEPETTSSE